MKSIFNLGREPAGSPILADDVLEFHAARVVLLIRLCGTSNRIDGLTKMAKLDFFVRYPQFFAVICQKLGLSVEPTIATVESSMLRFHYGPWDKRYYHVLAHLESKELIQVTQDGKQLQLRLTDLGKETADRLGQKETFQQLTAHMKSVKKVLGTKSGSSLKKLIYQVFEKEVANRLMDEVIK